MIDGTEFRGLHLLLDETVAPDRRLGSLVEFYLWFLVFGGLLFFLQVVVAVFVI